MFIGRNTERKALEDIFSTDRSNLVILYAAQIKMIEHIIMEYSELCQIAVSDYLSVECGQNNTVPVI